MKTSIAKRIKQARKINELTQAQLAKKCGIHQFEISRYETGAVIPSLKTLMKLAKSLKIEVNYFI